MKIWKGRSSITITRATDTGTPQPMYANLQLAATGTSLGELVIAVDIGGR